MKNSLFLVYMLILFSGLLAIYANLQARLSPVDRLETQISRSEESRREAEFRAQLTADRFADFKQQMAALLPDAIKGKDEHDAYPLRQMASVLTTSHGFGIEKASGLFELAKQKFRDKKFEDSNAMLQDLIQKYPESVHVVEAHFLLAEGQFQSQEYEDSVGTIEKMVDLFPENDLTGFALLRLGRIFENQDRMEDATDIYRAVISNFSAPELKAQAQMGLKSVAL
jgi:TolA-binding protein